MLREGIFVVVHFEEVAAVQPLLVFERLICPRVFVEDKEEGISAVENDHRDVQEEGVPDD